MYETQPYKLIRQSQDFIHGISLKYIKVCFFYILKYILKNRQSTKNLDKHASYIKVINNHNEESNTHIIFIDTACPRSLDQIFIESYYIKWTMTFWKYSTV